jgi:hypothetical protein
MRGGLKMIEYTYLSGDKARIPYLDKTNEANYIKVNLPDSAESYKSGHGEGVWAVVDDQTFVKHSNNENGISFAMILNDSLYYPGIDIGFVVPIELRGDKRPVVPYDELLFLYEQIPQTVKKEAVESVYSYLNNMP